MVHEHSFWDNISALPALADMVQCKRQLNLSGGEYHVLGNGDNNHSLEPFIRHLQDIKDRFPNDKMLTILDWDNVFVKGPLHAFWDGLKRYSDRSFFDKLRESGSVKRVRIQELETISATSDRVIIWTSRFYISDSLITISGVGSLLNPFLQGDVSFFPFFDDASVTFLESKGRDKLLVSTNKPIRSPANQLFPIIESFQPEIIHYVGSSHRDREAVVRLQQMFQGQTSIHFFDTGCWKI